MVLEIGKTYEVTVTQILPIGVVVKLEDESTSLIHISRIANCYVGDVGEFVSVGRTYTATAVASDIKGVELSLIPANLKPMRSAESYSRRPESRRSDPRISPMHAKNLESMIEKAAKQYEDKHQNKKRSAGKRK